MQCVMSVHVIILALFQAVSDCGCGLGTSLVLISSSLADLSSLAVDFIDTLHGQHVVNARV